MRQKKSQYNEQKQNNFNCNFNFNSFLIEI